METVINNQLTGEKFKQIMSNYFPADGKTVISEKEG